MNKREEIREGIARIGLGGINPLENARPNEYGYKIADDILAYLHSQNVVIKVDKEFPFNFRDVEWMEFDDDIPGGISACYRDKEALDRAGYVAVEPIVETCPKCGVEPHLCKCPTINRGSFAHYVED